MGFLPHRVRAWVLLGSVLASSIPLACGDDDAGPTSSTSTEAGAGGLTASGGQPIEPTGGQMAASGGIPSEGGTGGEPSGGQAIVTSSAGAGGEAGAGGASAGPIGQTFPKYPDVTFPPENPFTLEKAILGKILFWDEQLSSDNTVACGTCHRAIGGGSDPRGSSPASRHPGATSDPSDDIHGAQGIKRCTITGSNPPVYKSDPTFGTGVQVTKRRPPSYLDAMFATDVFWDGRATTQFKVPDTGEIAILAGGALESQSVGPPLNDAEMACEARTWPLIHTKLNSVQPLALARDLPPDVKAALAVNNTYAKLFNAAYGTTEINTKRIAFAIATHERRLTSKETPWDLYNAGDASALSAAQQRGLALFTDKGKCSVCHAPPLFTDLVFHNLGFINSDFDPGRQPISGQATDKGKVKTPTLRNVGLREPAGLLHFGYGPGASLETVMDSYNKPPNADGGLTDPQIEALKLTPAEISDMIDFIRHGLTDPRVAGELPPFDRPKLGSEP